MTVQTDPSAHSFEGASQVLRDGDKYSSRVYGKALGPLIGRTLIELDGPEHRLLRGALQPAFTAQAASSRAARLRHVASSLVGQLAKLDRVDLVQTVTFPFAVAALGQLLNLPAQDYRRLQKWSLSMISAGTDWERAQKAARDFEEYLGPILLRRRQDGSDDLITYLLHAEIENRLLTDSEVIAFLRLLLPAGVETIYRSLGNTLFALLTHPEQLRLLRDNPRLVPAAIEESLRWHPPVQGLLRTAEVDEMVEGTAVGRGTTVLVHLGSANRDPVRWAMPEIFDVSRIARPHLAFGAGPHTCLGIHFARLELTTAVEAMLEVLGMVRLEVTKPGAVIQGELFRSPRGLPVSRSDMRHR
jgi:cytochrome P450